MVDTNWWSNPGFKDTVQTVKAKVETTKQAQAQAGDWLKYFLGKFKTMNAHEKQVNLSTRQVINRTPASTHEAQVKQSGMQYGKTEIPEGPLPQFIYDPTMKSGDKVYLSDNGTVTNKPTNLELFKFGDFPVVAYSDADGMLHIPEAYREFLSINETDLQPVTYTPDLPFWLEPDKRLYDEQKPASISPSVKPTGGQGYLDPSNNQIVDYKTSIPLYWDAVNTGSITTFPTSATPQGLQKPNEPFLLEEDVVNAFAEELMAETLRYESSKVANYDNPQAMNPFLTAPVSGTVNPDSLIREMGTPQYTWGENRGDPSQVSMVYIDDDKTQLVPIEYKQAAQMPSELRLMDRNEDGVTFGETGLGKFLDNVIFGVGKVVMYELGDLAKQIANYKRGDVLKPQLLPLLFRDLYASVSIVPRAAVLAGTQLIAGAQIKKWKNVEENLAKVQKQQEKLDSLRDSRARMRVEEAIIIAGWTGQSKTTTLENLSEKDNKFVAAGITMDDAALNKIEAHLADIPEYLSVGKTGMAIDSHFMNLVDTFVLTYDYLNAVDYANALTTGTEDSVKLQPGFESVTKTVGNLTPAEIKALQKFISHNLSDPSLLPPQTDYRYVWTGNMNLAFLDYVARNTINPNGELPTLEQLHTMLKQWLPQVMEKSSRNSSYVGDLVEKNFTDRMARRREEAYALTNVAASWRNMIGTPGYEGAEQIAKSFEEAARNILSDTYHYYDQLVLPLNPYMDWSKMIDPSTQAAGYRNVANAEMQLKRPLSRTEIEQVMYYTQDPETELLGEIFLDFSFVLNAIAPIAKLGIKGLKGGGALLSKGVKATAALSDIGKVPKFVTKLGWKETPAVLRTVGKGFAAFDSATAKAALQVGAAINKMQESRLIRYVASRSMYSIATKRGQSASDLTMRILKQNPTDKQTWVKHWADMANYAKRVQAADDATQNIIEGLFNPIFGGKLTPRQFKEITELFNTIDPERWADEAAKVWDDVYATLWDGARNQILFKNKKPIFSSITEEVRNQIDALIKQEWDGWYAKHLLADRMNTAFKESAMFKFSNKLGGTSVLKDSIPGMIANIPYGTTGKLLGETRIGAALGGLEYINRAFMRLWTWATLARRPAWVVQNFVDNTFRYLMAAPDLNGNIVDLLKMLGTSKYYDELLRSGIAIPSTVTSGVVQDLTKIVSIDADKIIEALTLAKKTQELSASPLNLLAHYKLAYQTIGEGSGFFGKLWAGFKAFPTSIKTLNNSIEVGMKTHMYYKLYIKNIEQLNVRAVSKFLEGTVDEMINLGATPEMANQGAEFLAQAFQSAGGNSKLLNDLLDLENAATKQGYNLYLPQDLRKAEWFSETQHRPLLQATAREWTNYMKNLTSKGVKKIEATHIDEFFERMLTVFEGETRAKVLNLTESYNILKGLSLDMNAGGYAKAVFVPEEVAELTPDAVKLLNDAVDVAKLKQKQKDSIRKILLSNGIEIESVLDDTGYIHYIDGSIERMGLNTPEGVKSWNDAIIDQAVEEPARDLVRKLLGEGKIPVSSNAFGPGRKGVEWKFVGNDDVIEFTPLKSWELDDAAKTVMRDELIAAGKTADEADDLIKNADVLSDDFTIDGLRIKESAGSSLFADVAHARNHAKQAYPRSMFVRSEEEALTKAIDKLKEKYEAWNVAHAEVSREQLEAMARKLPEGAIPNTLDESLQREGLITNLYPNRPDMASWEMAAQVDGKIRGSNGFFSSDTWLGDDSIYRNIDKDLLKALVHEVINESNLMRAKILDFFKDVYPGPLAGGDRTKRNLWDRFFKMSSYTNNNLNAFKVSNIEIPLKNGTFNAGISINAVDMFEMAGIRAELDNAGEIIKLRIFNPVTGEIDEINNPVIVDMFKRKTGIYTQKDLVSPLRALDDQGNPKIVLSTDQRNNLIFDVIPLDFPSLEKMIEDDPRLALALTENRVRDANLLLAEKFQFPTMYKRQGVWTPDSKRLFNTVRKWGNLKENVDIKNLHTLPPEDTYGALKNWYESNVGVSFSSKMQDAKPKLIKAFQSIFNETELEAEGTYEFYKNIAEVLGKLSGDNGDGYEGWGVVLRALYRENGLAGTQIVRSFDGTMKLHSDMRMLLNREELTPLKASEFRRMLEDRFGKENVEFLGLNKMLRGSKQVSPQEVLDFVKKNERFVQSKPEGVNRRWFTSVKDIDGNDLYRFGADLDSRDTIKGTEYLLRVAEESGDLDDITKKYITRWAGDNGFAEVVFKDGTSSPTIVRDINMGSGIYGATTRIKSEIDSVQSIVRGYANANVTTGIHELFHAFYPFLPLQDKAVFEAWAKPIAEAWVKANPGKLTVEAKIEELITVAWEKFLVTTTDAPVEAQTVMDHMRNSMLSIYRKWDKYFDGIDMPVNVRQSFNNLLDKEYLLKQINELPKPKTGQLYQAVPPPNATPVGGRDGVFDWKVIQLLRNAPDKLQVNFIKNNLLQGVKADEKTLFSMKQFLEDPVFFATGDELAAKQALFKNKGMIMKEDVLNWIESRNIKVMEVVKGEKAAEAIKIELARLRKMREQLSDGWVKETKKVRSTLDKKYKAGDIDIRSKGTEAFYAFENLVKNPEWALSSLVEYGEDFIGSPLEAWLLTEATAKEMDTIHQIFKSSKIVYDELKVVSEKLNYVTTKWEDYSPRGLRQSYNEIIFLAPGIEKDAGGWITAAPYGSYTYGTHWGNLGDPMIHVRFGTYLDPDTNKAFLYVDEIQSDWSQQTRTRGSRFDLESRIDQMKKEKEDAITRLGMREWRNTDEYKRLQQSIDDINAELKKAEWTKTDEYKKLKAEQDEARKVLEEFESAHGEEANKAKAIMDRWMNDYYDARITSDQWYDRFNNQEYNEARLISDGYNDRHSDLTDDFNQTKYYLSRYVTGEKSQLESEMRKTIREITQYGKNEADKIRAAINEFEEEVRELSFKEFSRVRKSDSYYLMDSDRTAYEPLMALSNMSFTKDVVMHELVMKRLIQWCMDNNLDEIVLSPGRPHFERWGTEMIGWKKMSDGSIGMVGSTGMSGSELTHVIPDPNRVGSFTFTDEKIANVFSRGYSQRIVKTYEDVENIVRNNVYMAHGWYTERAKRFRIEKIARDLWDRIQAGEESGFVFPRAEGLTGFYDSSLVNNVTNFFKKNYKKTVEITDPATKKLKKVQVPGVEIEPYTLPTDMLRGQVSNELVEVPTLIEATEIFNNITGARSNKLYAEVPNSYGGIQNELFYSEQDIVDAFNKGYKIKFVRERELVATKIKFSPEAFEEAKLNGFTLMQKIESIPTDDMKVWAREMVQALDTLFVDPTTGFSTVFNNFKMKPMVVSIIPDGYNYIIHNFTEDQSKKYIETTADAIRAAVDDADLVTYQAEHGRFLVSFNTQEEIDRFLVAFHEGTSNPITFFGQDRTWNVIPEYSIGIDTNKNVANAFRDAGNQMTTKIDEAVDRWLLQSGIDMSVRNQNGNMEQMVSRLVPATNVQPGTLYQEIEGQLGVLHNIQINHLFEAINMWDGLPMPSIGIFKRGEFMESFGNATIVLKKDSIDPIRDIMNKIYDTDAYTPMIPPIVKYTSEPYAISIAGENMLDLAKSLGETEGQMAMMLDFIAAEDLQGFKMALMDSNVGMYYFLKAKGYDIDEILKGIKRGSKQSKNDITFAFRSFIGSDPDITKTFVSESVWKDSFIDQIPITPLIFDNGAPLEASVINLENYMFGGKDARALGYDLGEGPHIARAYGAYKFKTLDEIKKFAYRLTSDATIIDNYRWYIQTPAISNLIEDVRNFVGHETQVGREAPFKMYRLLGKFLRQSQDVTSDEVLNRVIRQLMKEQGISGVIPESLLKRVKSTADVMREVPETYFEAKPQRLIKFDEAIGIVIPDNTPQHVKDLLRSKGIEFKEYVVGDRGSRGRAIAEFQEREGALFQRIDDARHTEVELEAAYNAWVQAKIFEVGNEKLSIEDLFTVLFGSKEKLKLAGPRGLTSWARKAADQFEATGMFEFARIFDELATMGEDFTNYMVHNVIKADGLFPSPTPVWQGNDAIRKYVSSMYGVQNSYMTGRKVLETWRDSMKRNLSGSLLENTEIPDSVRTVIKNKKQEILDIHNQIEEIANYGGEFEGVRIDPKMGAVNYTNRTMMDYTDTSAFTYNMKMIMPFWAYPAKSIPYWTSLIANNPEVLAWYIKYERYSKRKAYEAGAVTSTGEVLPSLKGYIPLTDGLWWNPTNWLMYRFVIPRIANVPETAEDEDLGIMQRVAKFMLDEAPALGFNVGPVPAFFLQFLYEPYYNRAPLLFEGVKAVFPLDFLPPVAERWIMGTLRKTFLGTHIPERYMPEVRWKDLLIEREYYKWVLDQIRDMNDEESRKEFVLNSMKVFGDQENPREDYPEWIAARDRVESSQYFRMMAGHMSGVYTKPYDSGEAELNAIRDETNMLKAAIEDATIAGLFGISGNAEDRYEYYKNKRYYTSEGMLWSAVQRSRYVTDPETGKPILGQERRDEMTRQMIEEESVMNYYDARSMIISEYQKEVALLPVGNTKLRREALNKFYAELDALDSNPQFELAVQSVYLGWKPSEMIYEDLLTRFWRQIQASKPPYNADQSYDQYEKSIAEWEATIPEHAATLLPLLHTSIIHQINESGIKVDKRLGEVNTWIAQISQQANSDGYKEWQKSNDTITDAVWNAYSATYLQPFYDAVKGVNQWDRRLIENAMFDTAVPDPVKIVAWVQQEYGKKFTVDEIMNALIGRDYASPEEISNTGKSDIDLSADEIWDVMAALGPTASDEYKQWEKQFVLLGGRTEDINTFYNYSGVPSKYPDPEAYTEFLQRVRMAAEKVGLQPPTEEQMKLFSQAKTEQEAFILLVEKELGEDFYKQQYYYYYLPTDEREKFRKDYPDIYFKISSYYQMKDDYAKTHPVWSQFYHKIIEDVLTSGGTDTSDVDAYQYSGGSGGGYSSGGYSSSSSSYGSPTYDNWLSQGMRSRGSGMELLAPGALGSGGVTKRPWWPQELLELLHESAVAQIEQGYLTPATVTYLNRVAQSKPKFAPVIRDNLKKMSIGYYNEVSQKNKPVME